MWFRPHMRWIQKQISASCGEDAVVIGQMDDAAAGATPQAIAAIQRPLEARLAKDGAELRVDKCSWHTNGGPKTRAHFPNDAKVKSISTPQGDAYGMVMDGAAIGDDEFVQHHCRQVVDETVLDARAIEKALLLPGSGGRKHPETAWILLTKCVTNKMDHLLRTMYPADTKAQAARLDKCMAATATRIAGMENHPICPLDDGGGTGIIRERIKAPIRKRG